jgi:26S proteasome regulatory subunit T2
VLKLERVKDYLLLEAEFIQNQKRLRPHKERQKEERSKINALRGTPMDVGSLEEVIDDHHAIVSMVCLSSVYSEYFLESQT